MLAAVGATAQNKADRRVIKQIRTDIEYLASDELEGRRTASEGEQKAAEFIARRYTELGIGGYKGQYKHAFPFVYGKEVSPNTQVRIGSDVMKMPDMAFPLPFSGNTQQRQHSELLPDVLEQGNIWLLSLYKDQDEAADAHFDAEKYMYERAREAAKQGATGVIFYDGFNAKYPPKYNSRSDFESLEIPVAFLSFRAFETYVQNRPEGVPVELNISLKKKEYTGTNVAAFIDNHAPYTVVLGAHFDHLGYGEDGSSLHAGKDKAIHNGADDNASGTAALMELASWIQRGKLRKYNYLFVHFSGEELGLLGSKAFVKSMGLDSNTIAYMINMDMVGRLNDSTHALTVGGVGTSPVWGKYVSRTHKEFKINIDSSGVGPSDHTSFYHAGIPVLFFFTGVHHDYHKPSDDADKINYPGQVRVMRYIYSIVEKMDREPKPAFTPTRQNTVGKVRFKVTLGIMPDYSYQDGGVKVDGVSEDKPASKAGIQAGDVIIQLGEHKIAGMQSYMEALSKFSAGETTTATVLRNGETLTLNVTF